MWIIDGWADRGYLPLRDTLMTLQALNHLELQLHSFSTDNLRPPIVIPTIRFLQIAGIYLRVGGLEIDPEGDVCLDDIIHSIYAESLTTLSIDGWNRIPGLDLSRDEELKSHFPSLQHLILRNISPYMPDLRVVARRFPGIERLTCHAQEPLNPATSDIHHIITQAVPCPGCRERNEDDEGDATSRQCWPKLHTIAATASDTPLDVVALHDEISHLQGAGHPIRKLKLPRHLCQMAGAEAMAYLRTIVEVDDFGMDWPTPFEFI
ncbi:hypothetical protein FIBSPDRAFT_900901 [Athelia psychrophila]|uniref:F-box domain-containing protein n=1 Tax=Athelia psychrophila TaxID=1759441 RepID=A0A165XVF2_9AGAM|nr:hypothetical protein FIBSPDRAFT_900901 [Fibularhizoctonia sp. CBS 109695]